MNPEISAAITEAARARDKKLEDSQQQLDLGITTLNKAITILFIGDDKQTQVQAIKMLSDVAFYLTFITRIHNLGLN